MAMTASTTIAGKDAGAATASTPIVERILVDAVGEDLFRSRTTATGKARRIFGGQVAAQAVLAASLTAPEDRHVHSAQMTFLLPGDSSQPVDYNVTRVRDGASFAARQVDATQAGRTIFTMLASFQRKETGLSHQVPQPSASVEAAPTLEEMFADLPGEQVWAETMAEALDAELRFPTPPARSYAGLGRTTAPEQRAWMRSRRPFPPDDERLEAAGLAYFSDMLLLSAVLGPHGRTLQDPDLQNATINHTVWFHHPLRVDEWFLYDQRSRWSGGARALCHGEIFNQDGRLCATTMQEGLLRVRGDRA